MNHHLSLSSVNVHEVANEVAKALSYSKATNGDPRIVTPLLYPGGNRVVLGIREIEKGFIVSDFGSAARESDLLGGSKLFPRIAREQAQANDVRFDSDMIFDIHVPREALVTAAIIVANVAKTAVDITAFRLAEKREEIALELLLGNIERAFGQAQVVREAEVIGASSKWKVDAYVIRQHRPAAIVELVAANANSVNAAVTKFLDISRLGTGDNAERFAALVDSHKTPHVAVLGSTSRLVSVNDVPTALAA